MFAGQVGDDSITSLREDVCRPAAPVMFRGSGAPGGNKTHRECTIRTLEMILVCFRLRQRIPRNQSESGRSAFSYFFNYNVNNKIIYFVIEKSSNIATYSITFVWRIIERILFDLLKSFSGVFAKLYPSCTQPRYLKLTRL